MFDNTDVITLDLKSAFRFYRRQEVWILLFFAPDNDGIDNFKPEYAELQDKLQGIISVAAVDCKAEEEVCEEFRVEQYPTLMIYTDNYGEQGWRYTGKLKQGPIANAASKKMQNFVSQVTSDNYTSFFGKERMEKNKVLLFTDKKQTPAIYKALSKKYLGKLVFGEVQKSETDLVNQFQIFNFPTIMVLTEPENHVGEIYDGDLQID